MNQANKNRMKQIKIEKVTLNIGVGQSGDKLDKAMKLLSTITKMKPVQTKTMKRIPTWGLRPNLAIGCKVTIRGKKAEELLGKLLKSIDNKLGASKFDKSGNFSFGIKEYIDIQGVEYDMDIGIIGLETAVTLERPGFRVKKRKIKQGHIPLRHRISKEDAMEFVRSKFSTDISEGESET